MAKEEEQFLRKKDIETMKKDIVYLQEKGVEELPAVPSVSIDFVKEEEEAELRVEKERLKKELEERKRMEIQRREEIEMERLEKLKKERLEGLEKKEEKERAGLERLEREKKEKGKRELEEGRIKKEEGEKREKAEQRAKLEEESRRKEEERKKTEEIESIKEKRRKELEEESREKKEEAQRAELEEERRRKEEERRRKEDPGYRKKILLQENRKLREEEIEIDKKLKQLAEEKRPLEIPQKALLKEIEDIQRACKVISEREKRAEEEKRTIEEKEALAETAIEKRRIEKQRWKIEEKRRELEKKRWPWDEKIKQASEKIQEIESEYAGIGTKEEALRKRQKEISEKQETLQLEIEKIDSKEKLKQLEEFKKSLEKEKDELLGKLNEIEKKLETILAEEEKVEEDEKLVEEEERLTKDLEERKKLEKERWEMEEKRRKIESERWKIEEEKHKIEIQLKRIETRFQDFLGKAGNIIERIKEIAQLLGIEEREIEAPEEPEKKEKEKKIVKEKKLAPAPLVQKEKALPVKEKSKEEKEIEEAKKRIEALRKKREEIGKEELPVALAEEVEKAEEKKKKVAQEQEAKEILAAAEKKRKEAIERIKAPEREIKKPLAPSFPSPLKQPESIIRPLPKKPSLREKLWVRVLVFSLVLVLLAGVATFWYWYLVINKKPPSIVKCTTNADCPPEQICGPEEICVSSLALVKCTTHADCSPEQICGPEGVCLKKEIVIDIPPSLFLVDDTRTLTISDSGELRDLLLQTVQEWQEEGQFKRVIIKNTKENKVLNLREFFDALQIRVPEELYQKIGNNFTLFIYSQVDGNRIGFVTEVVEKEALINLLGSKEVTMKDDFSPLFSLMEAGEPALISYFRNSSQIRGYVGPNFRYQTLAQNDLGICYLVSSEYFIFVSSWKNMEKVINRLAVAIPVNELTTDLKYDDRGEEVKLLQTWLAVDPTVYPEGIISGWFGSLTRVAVIRFQEKYNSEILAPQGLYEGTGIVDLYTRIKLNELYGRSGIIPKAVELITDLRYGDHGDEVRLLQTWLAKDTEVYPKGITSGWFGPLTRAAVIRFQEKYALEILTPQGLSRATGIVDALTRQKLNALYGGQ